MLRPLIASFILFAALTCSAQIGSPSTISVAGDAEIRVVPDEVVLNMGVESADRSLRAAKSANDVAIQRALEVATHHGVPTKSVQTDYISIEPRYRRDEITGQLLGYVVRKSLTVRLSDISQFEELFTDLLDAGVNVVHGIEFRTTDLRKYRDQARALAIKAAHEKAQALAANAGRRAGSTLSISENGGGWYSPYSSWWGRSYGYSAQNVVQNDGAIGGSTEATLAPGQITVTAHVGITVALE
jgi:uncharacterized protein YggE